MGIHLAEWIQREGEREKSTPRKVGRVLLLKENLQNQIAEFRAKNQDAHNHRFSSVRKRIQYFWTYAQAYLSRPLN